MNFILLLFLLSVITNSQSVQANNLTVMITHIKNEEGQVAIALYRTEKDFMKTRFQGKLIKAVKGNVTVVFENLPTGEYAISILHDTNENGKMDTNFIGIPKEGYGFSNDVMGAMGPPSFTKAKFTLSEKTVIITMNIERDAALGRCFSCDKIDRSRYSIGILIGCECLVKLDSRE